MSQHLRLPGLVNACKITTMARCDAAGLPRRFSTITIVYYLAAVAASPGKIVKWATIAQT